ncbi:insulin-like growth factor 2 mRNA-binding protein 1 isoform X2 [Bemisia tabaci]|uniref:IGF-II mRNA-binding protein n=1 Tax=Bemisia tabaci TaxID=7038 RepID=A0A451FV13_BEMTA|nr:PREDICTED: insulin-like growth factor 2 mRNA-binding protein 1 isoform X3 [Bemisia tabaci]QAB02862.1 IGF-II mRNA-binding protein [Bemisia tabaci]
MNKLYVGSLPPDAGESSLRQLFAEFGIACGSITIKRPGYAFVDFPDQSSADKAIDKLNGYSFNGSTLVVEPSVGSGGPRKSSSSKVIVSNIANQTRNEDIEALLSSHGTIVNFEKLNSSRDGAAKAFQVSFETPEQAQQAVSEVNGYEIDGNILKADLAMDRRSRTRGSRFQSGGFSNAPGQPGRQTDFPLRVLVQSDMVGAIIGRQGSTIRTITQQTRASCRVDVHRKDNVGSLEKAISIYGNPENCTNACKKILEVMQQEANSTSKGEITLKILAHNNLIGRIIGKGGNTIKRIMQDTDTKITVSSINDINSFNLERIITVKGSIDNMSAAESQISAKLRQSYENDLQAMAPQSMMFPGLHPVAMMATSGMSYTPRGAPGYQPPGLYAGAPPAPYPPMYQPGPPPSLASGGDAQETTYLYIPNNAVGAIIGTKGSHIRNMIRFSGASVKIAPLEEKADPLSSERKVTIVGSPESQWKAQYLIFEKMREEGFVMGTDEVRLTVEILVPSSQVGRIIGKGGQNVRELQRLTGSIIKLPEQGSSHEEDTTVHIIGPFFSVQSAQRKIRSMVQPGPGGPVGRMPRHRGPPEASQ